MDTRIIVMKLMPAIVKILKGRFPNLTTEDTVKLASEICGAIKDAEEPDAPTIPAAG